MIELVVVAVLVALGAVLLNVLDHVKGLEARAERQADMLIALLQKNGINPVTLD